MRAIATNCTPPHPGHCADPQTPGNSGTLEWLRTSQRQNMAENRATQSMDGDATCCSAQYATDRWMVPPQNLNMRIISDVSTSAHGGANTAEGWNL